ncbi:MAG: hypothetical protein ILA15_07035 [Clostridiales bacterium]|nr:hypothetical protein [Clostridiales bacterium]
MSINLRRKVVGSLIASAVAISMIPAMAFADSTTINAMPTSAVNVDQEGQTVTTDTRGGGVTISVTGLGSNIGNNWGIGVGYTEGGVYTFTLDETAYPDYAITKIEIGIGNMANCEYNNDSTTGWDTTKFSANSTFTWAGTPTNKVSLALTATGAQGDNHYVNLSSITVYVDIPVSAFSVVDSEDSTSGYMCVGDEFPLFIDYDPETTTYDMTKITWSVSPETEDVRVEDLGEGDYIVVADTTGEFVITATVTGHPEVTASYTVTIADEVEVLRLFYPDTGEHLYTIDMGEAAYLEEHGWSIEGSAWTTPSISSIAVYRLFNDNNGEHLYTADEGEAAYLETLGWKIEGIAWYAHDDTGVPVYRVFNPSATTNTHLITADEGEIDHLVNAGWKLEGVAMYACPDPVLR